MLDFSRLQAPPNDGDVLLEPAPSVMVRWAQENHEFLQTAPVEILGRSLHEWRTETRTSLAGDAEQPVIVLGHQPEFMHAGVWAKHVVACRFAQAVGGKAINLVVDNDAPRTTALLVPVVKDGSMTLQSIRSVDARAGYAFEQIDAMTAEELHRFAQEIKTALGSRFEQTSMATYLTALEVGRAGPASQRYDWVAQQIAGRQAIEGAWGIELEDVRVSETASRPVLADLILNAERFRTAYNKALASYRTAEGIRGQLHPIPNLTRADGAVETPIWVYRRCEARRRLFVRRSDDALQLLADRDPIDSFDLSGIRSGDDLVRLLEEAGGWRIRPRALALTLWARLFLADLFIHGIGGAKYDRITDAIIRDYYGVAPPRMACVSATLLLELPRKQTSRTDVRAVERELRDIEFNPQRHVEPDGAVAHLIEQRAAAVERSEWLRQVHPADRRARRSAFRQIRALNTAILETSPELRRQTQKRLENARSAEAWNRIALGREYFFALHSEASLDRLMETLPSERDFAL